MGEDLTYGMMQGTVFIKTEDGYEELGNMEPVSILQTNTDENKHVYVGSLHNDCSVEFTVTAPFIKKRFRNLLIYGWRAKGPYRKRAVVKAMLRLHRSQVQSLIELGRQFNNICL